MTIIFSFVCKVNNLNINYKYYIIIIKTNITQTTMKKKKKKKHFVFINKLIKLIGEHSLS